MTKKKWERALVFTMGLPPEILTETLWALFQDGWYPDRIEVITTYAEARGRWYKKKPQEGEINSNISLLRQAAEDPEGPLQILYQAKGSPLPLLNINVPLANGGPKGSAISRVFQVLPHVHPETKWDTAGLLTDIVTRDDSLQMAECLWSKIKELRGCSSEIHVSAAGGRKTMATHALAIVSLLGRATDQASQTLVSPAFENAVDPHNPGQIAFWHPGYEPDRLIKPPAWAPNKDEKLYPKNAEITLVEMPFYPPANPSLRDSFKEGEKELQCVRALARIRQFNTGVTPERRQKEIILSAGYDKGLKMTVAEYEFDFSEKAAAFIYLAWLALVQKFNLAPGGWQAGRESPRLLLALAKVEQQLLPFTKNSHERAKTPYFSDPEKFAGYVCIVVGKQFADNADDGNKPAQDVETISNLAASLFDEKWVSKFKTALERHLTPKDGFFTRRVPDDFWYVVRENRDRIVVAAELEEKAPQIPLKERLSERQKDVKEHIGSLLFKELVWAPGSGGHGLPKMLCDPHAIELDIDGLKQLIELLQAPHHRA